VNSKMKSLLIGGAAGALIGLLAGWLYFNAKVSVDESGAEHLAAPTPATGVKLGLGLLGVIRQIVE